ncbi:MAG: hypothetical protein EOM54_09640 [Clostridia bacterium]|nr:hypothetical protein [Clostridia bacterium]
MWKILSVSGYRRTYAARTFFLTEMKNENSEQVRASNIIWNASGDYSFDSELSAYDEDGRASLYMNYIIGSVRRYYDYALLSDYFAKLDRSIDHELFEELIWTGLENSAYLKGRVERPVLDSLRQSYAKRYLIRCGAINADANVDDSVYYDYILDEVKTAHFRKALGETPNVSGLAEKILRDLEFDASSDTEQIIRRMDGIISDYFKAGLINRRGSTRKNRRGRVPMLKFSRNVVTEFSDGLDVWGTVRRRNIKLPFLARFVRRGDKAQRRFIRDLYGASIFTEKRTEELEHELCSGVHGSCRLHFTRGESPSRRRNDAMVKQRKKNERSYKEDFIRNRTSIIRLSHIIKNAMLINMEADSTRSDRGMLEAGKAWRNVIMSDDRVFARKLRNEAGDLSVDIMIDASASQVDRQEIIATEAYIIAESLTLCRIPVRVFSYCSEKEYTVINFFRDYGDTGKNERIFNYFASGCNRDGMAVRTAVDMIKKTDYEHKVLIVLTDGLPNDNRGVPVGRFVAEDYLGSSGVNDTALEVRKGWRAGISILCVFTGRDSNIPDAKKIFGHNLACIKAQNRFAEIVGVMIQNELRNF